MGAATLTVTAFSASAQDGDVAAGRTFAREACNSCRVVEPTNASPRLVVIGPNFQDIANQGYDGDGSAGFSDDLAPKNAKSDPHVRLSDVIAYILSLREGR